MLLTLQEYADKMGVTFGTVRNMVSSGVLVPDVKFKNRWYIDAETPWPLKHRPHSNLTKSEIYNTWRMMKTRCYYPKHKEYYRYGGRGITICDEWLHDSGAFIEWAETHGWEKGLQIHRIDNDKGYSPENCKFVTPQENTRQRDIYRKQNLIAKTKGGLR